ncbi:RsmB/NOP family class I SAM-dependent RNA methyltransferase [Sphingobacterium lactis]|uniref:RsmB/NOP family class I SAM-dependent RNA methyltransferase n=1 Tax=Sphingobacterium lactis TaxID=797291 RepID=UPI003F8006D6
MEINSKRVLQQIRNFERCLESYSFKEPFARFLTQFYKLNKQMGSSDRRMNSRYCYNYFRIGKALLSLNVKDRLCIAEFLCEQQSAVVAVLQPEWLTRTQESLLAKIEYIQSIYGDFLQDVFPFASELSPSIDRDAFVSSHFIQPDLFIRVQRGQLDRVVKELNKHEISFESLGEHTLVLPNGTNLQQLHKIEGLYEVQDLSSQQTLNGVDVLPKSSWWDCCAASGGKALMLLDKEPDIKLLVSDIRLSILRNLDERFERAGIKTYYRKKILDLSIPVTQQIGGEHFDAILLDAPCSGSGTWGRSPEMLSKFKGEEIARFAELQFQIAKNVLPFLKVGKPLIYITCSVYEKENEAVVNRLAETYGLKIEAMESIIGYNKKADSMFVARLIKP